jgi:hypothetical protein
VRAFRTLSPMTFLNFDWRVFFNNAISKEKNGLKYSHEAYLSVFRAASLSDPIPEPSGCGFRRKKPGILALEISCFKKGFPCEAHADLPDDYVFIRSEIGQ